MTGAAVQVRGLDEFRRELRGAKDLGRALGQAHKQLGGLVVQWAESEASGQPRRTASEALARGAVKPSAKQRSLSVFLDPNRFGGVLGAEFGAKAWPQFDPWVGNQHDGFDPDAGYFVVPGVARHAEELDDAYLDAIEQHLTPAFPNT